MQSKHYVKKALFLIWSLFIGGIIHAQVPIIYVDQDATSGANDGSSWDDAYLDLVDALDEGFNDYNGTTHIIWVAEGTYKPGTTRADAFVVPNRCRLLGGFNGTETATNQRDPNTNITILSGEIGNPDRWDNIRHIVRFQPDASWQTLVNGFTITRGYANGTGYSGEGAGMLIETGTNTTTPTVTQNIFTDNYAFRGSAYTANRPGVILENNTFTANQSVSDGGAVYCYWQAAATNAKTTVRNNDFINNKASSSGGALFVNVGIAGNHALEIYGNAFIDNEAGALYNGVINTFALGGAIYLSTVDEPGNSYNIYNNEFIRNESRGHGGAIGEVGYQTTLPKLVTNCTFHENKADIGGAVVAIDWVTEYTFENCILTGNRTLANDQWTTVGKVFFNSAPGVGGAHFESSSLDTILFNTHTSYGKFCQTVSDPKYVDEANDDLSLQSSSPLIDIGFNTLILSLTSVDLSGNTRFVGSAVDFGAYENQQTVTPLAPSPQIEAVQTRAKATSSNIQLFPNPAKDQLSIEWANVDLDAQYELSIYNTNGNELYHQMKINATELSDIDISFLEKGYYIISLHFADQIIGSAPFIKH